MNMSGVNEIRSKFLDFFAENGHEIVPSSPLVPRNDPTLMFTNAGMVQFKNVFTGVEKRPYQRATTSQKCVRAGGKHNDLDNVGYTARHLTFFEMLGNFSFGDYFKERAIELAWKLITKDFGLKKDKLLVTVYHDDDEAAGHWKKIAGFSDDRIIRIATSDNFWAMGDTGPCGPCSEIFIDRGEHIWGGPPGSPEEDGDRFLEFWNLVFMQFEQVTKEERQPLPRPSIDTGLGLERMACILQGVDSVFETDLFRNLIDATASALGRGPQEQTVASFRVIADHLRSSAFLVADGVLPSNEGRGYVLRRIMRRAMRHAQLLGASEPLMHRLVWALVREMGQAYPDLVRAETLIEETLRLEETRFRKTLERGLAILDEKSAGLKKGDMFDGDTAFTLYDTYGFPLDLTQDALKSRGISVDQASFTDAMERQREKARAAWAGSGDTKTADYWFPLRERLGATEFLGYDTEISEGVVRTIIRGGPEFDELKVGESGEIVVNQTPFYAESGGQVSDRGWIKRVSDGETIAEVLTCHKEATDLIVHNVKVIKDGIKKNDAIRLEVDHDRRSNIRKNHSATHILHEALRQVLGDHIAQRGSMVAPDRLRFDFVHPKPITAEELARVEDIANEVVLENDEVTTRLMAVDDAREAGARALFGEKYGDEVRVVSMGKQTREQGQNALGWSVELCGGTHVRRTGDIGLISVTSESAVASGVRRIEALTGSHARHVLNELRNDIRVVSATLNAPMGEITSRATAIVEERKKLEREVSEARKKIAMGSASAGTASEVEDIQGVKVIAKELQNVKLSDLRSIADDYKKRLETGVVILTASSDEGKVGLVVAVTPNLTSSNNAVQLLQAGVSFVGGSKGGGRADFAQGGGNDPSGAKRALEEIKQQVRPISVTAKSE
jgi:alanyl-tRNA synthetase